MKYIYSNQASKILVMGTKVKAKQAKKLNLAQELYKTEADLHQIISNFNNEKSKIGLNRGTFKASKIHLIKPLYD